jgi:AsmA protein
LRWSGLDLPLGPLIQAFALDGEIVVNGREVSWPTARLTVSGDRLEGALSSRHEGERRKISGTLAADRLDLTAFAAPLLQARSRSGTWSSDGIDLHGQSGTDLDLRVSAPTARIGSVRVDDLAANISVKGSRYEASIGHAAINKGVIKGRATLASAADGVEVKGQSSFERLDLASLLADMGLSRWVGGLAQGQFAFEGSGDTAAEIVRSLHGRASVTVRQGELVGVGLNEVLRRADGRPSFSPVSRWSRVPFDQAHLNVTILDGTAEISNGALAGAGLRAAVQGRASLSDRMLAVKANVEGNGPSPAVVVEVAGPWDNVAIVPDGGRNGGTSNPSALVQ